MLQLLNDPCIKKRMRRNKKNRNLRVVTLAIKIVKRELRWNHCWELLDKMERRQRRAQIHNTRQCIIILCDTTARRSPGKRWHNRNSRIYSISEAQKRMQTQKKNRCNFTQLLPGAIRNGIQKQDHTVLYTPSVYLAFQIFLPPCKQQKALGT